MNKKELQTKIGHRIRMLRQAKGLALQRLAAECNMEKSNLSRLEAGRTNPTVYTLYKIAVALEVSVSELVDV